MTPFARLWARAAAAAAAVAALAGLLPLAPALRAGTGADRARIWLLAVWTAGVLAILLGVSGWISSSRGLGFRDVARAGGLQAAAEQRRKAREGGAVGYGSFAAAVGLVLLAIYFAGRLVLPG